jgi:hypothetical protein
VTEPAKPPNSNRMMRWFTSSHLPPHLGHVAENCADLAVQMDMLLPEGPEKTAGLRKLLEAKDCFVRAAMELHEAHERRE